MTKEQQESIIEFTRRLVCSAILADPISCCDVLDLAQRLGIIEFGKDEERCAMETDFPTYGYRVKPFLLEEGDKK